MVHPTKCFRACASVLAVMFAMVAAAQAGTFNQVAVHPEVALQPTSWGNRIATLKPFNGRLYAGYGDYGANTGPVAIRAYDPVLGDFTAPMVTSRTEAVYIYREIGGKLYAPNIDTTIGGTGYAVGTAGPGAGGALDTWEDLLPVGGIHMFDMGSFGGDLFMGGSSGPDAVVWRSTDNGATWNETLRINPTVEGGFARVYGMAEYDGKLYADVDQHNSGAYLTTRHNAGRAQVWDGTSWTEGPYLTKDYAFMSHPEEFAGSLVYLNWHSGIAASVMSIFNGRQVRDAVKSTGKNDNGTGIFWDYTIADGVLYGLQSNGEIRYTTDLRDWPLLDIGPFDARSIGVLDDKLYLGAMGGLLYEYDTLLSTLPAPSLLTASGGFTEVSTLLGAIPEPASAVLLVAGVALLATRRRATR